MTPEELKFALLVENVLNHIPQPEYRQLVVETLIVLTLLADSPSVKFLSDNLNVDQVLVQASDKFFDDEVNVVFRPRALIVCICPPGLRNVTIRKILLRFKVSSTKIRTCDLLAECCSYDNHFVMLRFLIYAREPDNCHCIFCVV